VLPDVPTLGELGIPDFHVATWNGLMGPAGLPRPIVDRLNREVNAALASPEVKERLTALSAEVLGGTPEEFAAFYARDIRSWGEAIRKSGATAD
jgi:tripartite-type tricarboxylate transporter receptor subunit TctC